MKSEKKKQLTKNLSIVSHKSLIKTPDMKRESNTSSAIQNDKIVEEVHDDHSASSFEEEKAKWEKQDPGKRVHNVQTVWRNLSSGKLALSSSIYLIIFNIVVDWTEWD